MAAQHGIGGLQLAEQHGIAAILHPGGIALDGEAVAVGRRAGHAETHALIFDLAQGCRAGGQRNIAARARLRRAIRIDDGPGTWQTAEIAGIRRQCQRQACRAVTRADLALGNRHRPGIGLIRHRAHGRSGIDEARVAGQGGIHGNVAGGLVGRLDQKTITCCAVGRDVQFDAIEAGRTRTGAGAHHLLVRKAHDRISATGTKSNLIVAAGDFSVKIAVILRCGKSCTHAAAAGVFRVGQNARIRHAEKIADKTRITVDLAQHVLPQRVLGIEGQAERHGNAPEFVLGCIERLAAKLDQATEFAAHDQFFRQFDRRAGRGDADRQTPAVGTGRRGHEFRRGAADHQLLTAADKDAEIAARVGHCFNLDQLVQFGNHLIALVVQIIGWLTIT